MARQRRLSFEFKRNVVLDFLERRQGTRELARKHSLSRKLIRLWGRKVRSGRTYRRSVWDADPAT
jgi:transposase-like protein